jgi:hypothetical protein
MVMLLLAIKRGRQLSILDELDMKLLIRFVYNKEFLQNCLLNPSASGKKGGIKKVRA